MKFTGMMYFIVTPWPGHRLSGPGGFTVSCHTLDNDLMFCFRHAMCNLVALMLVTVAQATFIAYTQSRFMDLHKLPFPGVSRLHDNNKVV